MKDKVEIKLKSLDDFYKNIKKISSKYYQNGQMIKEYQDIKKQILQLEYSFSNMYITDVKILPKPVKDLKNDLLGKMTHYYFLDETAILDYLVALVREQLIVLTQKHFKIDIPLDINNLDLTNYCYDAALITKRLAESLGLESQIKEIAVGFDYQTDLFKGSGKHFFAFVKVKDKQFLVDLTYKQFFKLGQNSFERLGVPLLCAPKPGAFMLINSERLLVAKSLLQNGYLAATSENLKAYFDGFALSFRNGLYYEDKGDACYMTEYSSQDYLTFLKTSDSQVKREGRLFLGLQSKPLNNPKFKFKK